jgi:tetratricopeptide (TPR) repeat protein
MKEAIAAAEVGLAFETKFLEDLIKKADDQAEAAKDAKGKNAKVDKNAPPQQIVDKNSDAFKKFAADTESDLMVYYQALMSCYQQLNDAPKAIEWGQKAVMEKPDDLMTLLTLSSVMAARPPADPKQLDQQMKDAEDYAKQALTQATALFSGPMGAQLSPVQKADLLSGAHETLGRVYINTKRFGDAEKEYGAAIAAKKDDGDAYYFLGFALAQEKPPRIEESMDAFAKSVFLKGATAPQATDVLKQMYQNLHHNLDGFDDFVKAAGAKIGK